MDRAAAGSSVASRDLRTLRDWRIMRSGCALPALDAACAGDVAVTSQHCELMTGGQRVRFAGCGPITGVSHAVETFFGHWLVIRTEGAKVQVVFSLYVSVSQHTSPNLARLGAQ